MNWINRVFAVLTFGPVVLWLLCILVVVTLGFGFGCVIAEDTANPCTVLGLDLADEAHALGIYAAWGFLLVAPLTLASGLLWIIVAVLRSILRSTR